MKIIIFGASEMGYLIANSFYEIHDITLIDQKDNLRDEFNRLDLSFVDGNAASADIMMQAGIKDASIFIACTDSDESNIIACLSAKKLAPVKTICFVTREEHQSFLNLDAYSDSPIDFLYIDDIIWPDELLTQEIFRIVAVAKALDVESFASGKAMLLEYKIEEDSPLVNTKIRNCHFPEETLIVGITRNCELFIPDGSTELKCDDKVIFMGSSKSLDILSGKFFHNKKEFVKTVSIIGGGNVGLMLAKNLEKVKIKTKIIERDIKRCELISKELTDTLIINGDGTNLELLNEENIGESDVVVSITNNDEKNLLCSLLAKQLGVKRVISRVSKVVNIPLFEKVGIDIAVSSKCSALNEVKNDLCESNVDILATVEQGKGEVLDIIVGEEFQECKIMEFKLPAKAIVGIIQRRHKVIIPKGDNLIRKGDELIIFTLSQDAPLIREFFKVS